MKDSSMLKSYLITTAHQKIMDFFASHPGQSFYGAELARENKLSVGAVNKALRDFLRENILEKTRKGNTDLYFLKEDQPIIRQLKILSTIINLEPLVKELEPLCHKIILYGSASRGTNDKDSDIDLLVVSTNTDKELVKERILDFQNRNDLPKIQDSIKTSIQWANLEEKDPTYFQEVLRGITLWDRANSQSYDD